jgi:hypothetical protein
VPENHGDNAATTGGYHMGKDELARIPDTSLPPGDVSIFYSA